MAHSPLVALLGQEGLRAFGQKNERKEWTSEGYQRIVFLFLKTNKHTIYA